MLIPMSLYRGCIVFGNTAHRVETASVLPEKLRSSGKPFSASLNTEGLRLSTDRNKSDAVIMMVDDEPTTLDVVQKLLEDAGYSQFVTTSDSSSAMELLQQSRPDLVLLDLNMPSVDGFDILASIRMDRSLARIPVVILTSSHDASTRLDALQLGATDFLAKPVDASELVLRVRNNLAVFLSQAEWSHTVFPDVSKFRKAPDWLWTLGS